MIGTMDMATLLSQIRATPDCTVHPPAGLPILDAEHALPEDFRDFFRSDLGVDPATHVLSGDLREFYQLCGGVTLFQHADFSFSIVPPDQLVVANPILLQLRDREQWLTSKGHISWSRYLIATDGSTENITIDLSRDHLGRCYDSFWDVYPEDSAVIAQSFLELLAHLFAAQGKELYWTQPGLDYQQRFP
jgi:antitoxin YokJ